MFNVDMPLLMELKFRRVYLALLTYRPAGAAGRILNFILILKALEKAG